MPLKPTSSLMEPFAVQLDLVEGVVQNPHSRVIRPTSAMKGYYADEAALEMLIASQGDPIHYETFESPVPEPFVPGRLVYAPPCWAHRSINTGDEPLISLCIYPGDAGHNYGDIRTEGFPRRVFSRHGQLVIS